MRGPDRTWVARGRGGVEHGEGVVVGPRGGGGGGAAGRDAGD